MENTSEITNNEVLKSYIDWLNLLKDEELVKSLCYIINECGGKVVLNHDGRPNHTYSSITVYSERFEEKDLNVLFKSARHTEVSLSMRYKLMKVDLEVSLNKGA